MRTIFVINPVAGRMDPAQLLTPPIRSAARSHPEHQVEIHITTGRGDAESFVRGVCGEARDPVRFISCGGDGTLNEVVNGMADCPRAQLGLIPCGSGNDFIKMFPDRDFFSIPAQLEADVTPIDLMRVNDRYSINITNMGMDSDAADNMTRFKRLPLISGKMAYNLGLLYSVCQPLGHQLRVVLDDSTDLSDRYILAVAANGQFYGGHFRCAPKASVDDGVMDICLVKKLSRLKIPGLLSIYMNGQHPDNPRVSDIITYRKCRKMEITADKPVSLALDGEITHSPKVTIELVPGAISFVLPRIGKTDFTDRVAQAQKGENFGD